jgi:hypothetical protein
MLPPLLLASVAGCTVSLRDEVPEILGHDVLDVLLDRPRVLAVRMTPPVARQGEPVTIDALGLGPDGDLPWRVEAGGWDLDLPLRGGMVDAFRLPELVRPLGDDLPLQVDAPSWQEPEGDTPCTDRSQWTDVMLPSGETQRKPGIPCTSQVAVRLTLGEADDAATAIVGFPVALFGWDDVPVQPLGGHVNDLDVPETAAPGDEVPLAWTVGLPEDVQVSDSPVRWYVDRGELVRTGVTGARFEVQWEGLARAEPGEAPRRGLVLIAENVLRLPLDVEGPVRVVAVLVAQRTGPRTTLDLGSDMTWAVRTIEVVP